MEPDIADSAPKRRNFAAPGSTPSRDDIEDQDSDIKSSTPSSTQANKDIEEGIPSPQIPAELIDKFFVAFDPNDPDNPKSWTPLRRWCITVSMGLMVFTVTFASSIFSVNIPVVQAKFAIQKITATLGVALFVLGFVFGPIAFGPLSEVLGRRIPLFAGFALFAIFQIPVALAQNIETICIGRFLGGFFASAPLSVVGGALADLWDPIPRAYAICVFAAGGFAGTLRPKLLLDLL